mmetsp:Transcript_12176/g.18688  ORF Transcript_12176/g.18688 Transcript_12176/m.18688 type:complete len:212 (+) Transcript_12176:16-651(+)
MWELKTFIPSSENTMAEDCCTRKIRPHQYKQWHNRFKELVQFRLDHGHCLVPHDYPPNNSLARWAKRQRYLYSLMKKGKESSITMERIQMLNNIGFVWDSHDAAWHEKFEQAQLFKEKYGHCFIPINYQANPQLATWAKCQRRQRKLFIEGKPANISPERITALDKIGFEWTSRLSQARELYRTENISIFVPQGENSSDYEMMKDVLSILK